MDNERDYSRLHIIGRTIGVAIVIGAVAASIYAFRRNFVNPRTDDAAVRANVVGIAPHVSGPIVDLRVADNQFVKQGDLLFAIDCRPYEARLARARADLSLAVKEVDAQRKTIASTSSEIARREASLAAAAAGTTRSSEERAAAEAMVAKLQAEADYAEDYLHRVERLVDRQFVTADKVAEARSRRDATAAAVEQDVAQRRGAARAVEQSRYDVSRAQDLLAQIGDVNARIQAAEASVRAAELDVGYCRVSAPFDAYVTNLNIAVGEYARQGQQIFALVDNRAWYVLANFRETYMSFIKPGMEAEVYLLSYPSRRFRGVVQGIGWANKPQDGATVGVLPEIQQTLNWVRLANRFQVRVRLEQRDPEHPFRMGTTAVVTIHGFPRAASSGAPPR